MSIAPATGTTATTSANTASRATIADNFDTFLQILTTQLRNQNPLDPLDTNQFTQQLVQFTSVEQQLKTNQFLEALMNANKASVNTDAVSYIGMQVTAAGNKAELRGGAAVWSFNAAADVAQANVTIRDAQGNVVYAKSAPLSGGQGNFAWDGRGSDGNLRPEGIYTLSIEGRNQSGQAVQVTTASTGIVGAVDFSGDTPVLTVGRARILLTDVTDVRLPPASPS